MAHLPWHKETTTKPNRPKGMPAFLSYTPPPKEDSWKTLSSKQLTERFNKNQQGYKKNFLKKKTSLYQINLVVFFVHTIVIKTGKI